MSLGEYIPNTNTLGLWHLNGNSADSTANGHNGTDTNVTYSQANGVFGQGAWFSGSTKIVTANNIGLVGNAVFTISFWAQSKTAFTNYQTVFSWGVNSVAGSAFSLMIHPNATSGKGELYLAINASEKALYPTEMQLNTWYNIIVTKAAGGLSATTSCYLNGNKITVSSGPTTALNLSTSVVTIGYATLYSNYYFNGYLDDIICENVVWTQAQISKYYQNTKGRFGII